MFFFLFTSLHVKSLALCVWEWRRYTIQYNVQLNRKQYVQGRNTKSSLKSVNSGVLQGSILDPLCFFIIYKRLSKLKFFENYFILWWYSFNSERRNLGKLQNSVNCELTNVMDWLTANKLSLNISKPEYMLLTNTHASTESFVINANLTAIVLKHLWLTNIVTWYNCRWKTDLERAL